MGLDTSHDCWHGPYGAFMHWRLKLAEVAGIPLPLMDSFFDMNPYVAQLEEIVTRLEPPSIWTAEPGGGKSATRASLLAGLEAIQARDPDAVAMQSVLATWLPFVPLSWDVLKPDVLHVLLNHSDCDGEIAAEWCLPLSDRLEELLPNMEDWTDKTQQFIDGLRKAAARKQKVTFR